MRGYVEVRNGLVSCVGSGGGCGEVLLCEVGKEVDRFVSLVSREVEVDYKVKVSSAFT